MLKYLAILSMLLDHINLYIFNREYEILTFIGRFAFPLFIYLSVKAYMYYTKNKIQYIERIIFFAFVTLFTFQLFINSNLLPFNILFTIVFGLTTLWFIENKKYEFLPICFVPSLYVEYSFFGVLAFVGMYNFLLKRDITNFLLLVVSLFLLNQPSDNLYLPFFLLLIYLDFYFKIDYKTSLNKYFFYLFYPVHLIILGVLK